MIDDSLVKALFPGLEKQHLRLQDGNGEYFWITPDRINDFGLTAEVQETEDVKGDPTMQERRYYMSFWPWEAIRNISWATRETIDKSKKTQKKWSPL